LLEALFDSAIDYAIIGLDLDGLVTVWNEGAHHVLGWTEEEMMGRPASLFFTLDDRRAGIPQVEMHMALVNGRGSDERFHMRKDGSTFFASGEMMPLKDADGTVQGFLKILRDRTIQWEAAEKHRQDAEFLNGVLASSTDCIEVIDLEGRLLFVSAGGLVSKDATKVGSCWLDTWPQDCVAAAAQALNEARAGSAGHFQATGKVPTGVMKWWDVQVTPILGPDQLPEKLLAVSRDITLVKESEQRQQLLTQELAHRVKNTLALVQGIALQTFRGTGSMVDLRNAFTGRLQSLSRAHDVLLQGDLAGADIRYLLNDVAAVHVHGDEARFTASGPEIALDPNAAQTLALVLHELGTNAVKYGALSNALGRVHVTWDICDVDGEPHLQFDWREVGGPAVEQPIHQGFGSRLIERTLVHGLGARVGLHYARDGVHLNLSAALAKMQRG
jgi:PAS domain S-box-containing protein